MRQTCLSFGTLRAKGHIANLTMTKYKIFRFLKRKYATIFLFILSAIISLLYGFKHALLLYERGWQIHDTIFFTSFEAWDVDHYLAQIKEILEGNYLLSNAYLAEYKQTERSPWPLFPNFLMAFALKLLHIEVQHLAVLMDFLLPPLIFLIAYWLLSITSSGKYAAMVGAFLLVVIPHITRIDVLAYIGVDLLQKGFVPPILSEAHCYYCFSGTINPQLTYPFLLAVLLFYSKGLTTLKRRYWLLAGLFGVITSYAYVYFSSYLYAFLAVSALGFWWLKDIEYFRKSLFLLGGILLCSLPFWLPLFNFSGEEMGQMAFMQKTHRPIFSYSYINTHIREQILFTVFLCTLILFWIRKGTLHKIPGMLAFSLLFSGLICLEQQIITGIVVQPWHYDAYVIPQATILALTVLVMELLPKCSFHRFPTQSALMYGGISVIGVSLFLHPRIVTTYLSSDGILTPAFASFLRVTHLGGLLIGVSLLCLRLLSSSRFSQVWSKTSFDTPGFSVFRKIFHPNVAKAFWIFVILYITYDVGLGQYAYYYQNLKPKFGYLQQLAPALNWLNEHTPPESVVFGSPDHTSTNSIIPIYTHNNVYVTFHSQFYTFPSLSQISDRLYIAMYVMGIRTQQEFDEYLEDHWFEEGIFADYQQRFSRDVYSELTTYQVDYLLYGPRERKNFGFDPEEVYAFLEKQYDDGVVKIFRVL